jgi:hypothetical protein
MFSRWLKPPTSSDYLGVPKMEVPPIAGWFTMEHPKIIWMIWS